MAFRVGDTVFTSSASPATVVGKNATDGTVQLDRDYQQFQANTRHGLHNDMAPEHRERFFEIMDEIKSNVDDRDKVEMLLGRIEELKLDPLNTRLVSYLDGELRHLMHVKGVKPRFFTVDESKIR